MSDECPAVMEDLICALLPEHECEWHWDPRGIDWRPNPGVPVVLG